MNRLTVLKSTGCDLRSLPLGAREAFFLSQIDGQLSLEEIAAVAGLDLDDALALAEQLVDLGAVATLAACVQPSTLKRSSGVGVTAIFEERRADRVDPRSDPRAERDSIAPRSEARRRTPSPEVEKRPGMAKPPPSSRNPTPRPEQRRSRSSARGQRAAMPVSTSAAPVVEAADLDATMVATLAALDAKLGTIDHYTLLEVERGADKKTIKRAYFRLAATFHPDRFFGKRLGSAKAPLERVFHRMTEAHDTLIDVARRAEYDAKLPPAPPKRPSSKGVKRPSSRHMKVASPVKEKPAEPSGTAVTAVITKRRSSKSMTAVTTSVPPPHPSVPPPSRTTGAPPPHTSAVPPPRTTAAPPPRTSAVPPPRTSVPPPSSVPSSDPQRALTASPERIRQLREAAMEIKVQANVDLLVKAAEDAIGANDFVGAANNYRLALSLRDDPALRLKYEAVDARARIVRFEKNLAPAKAAEREQRWADAASFLIRAHEARPDADVAARAANALRLGGGDLERAATLAAQAVALEPKNANHHFTLCEVHLAAKRFAAAHEAVKAAAAIAPKDARLKELSAAIDERERASKKK